jgi:WD40 repeat protein
MQEFQAEAGAVQTLAFAADGKTLAVASFSRELRLFDVGQKRESSEARVIEIDDSRITAVGFMPNGKQIVIAAANGTALVREIGNDEKRISLGSYPFAIWSLAFDEDGQRMVAGSWDGTTRIWDTSSWQVVQKLKGHEESVSAMILGRQGMVSAGLDGRLLFWPPQISGIKPKGMITGPADPVWVAVYSPDGKRLFLGGRGERFEMWDVEKHEQLFSIKGHSTTRCAAFSPDGKTLATGGDDRTIMLSSAEDGQIRHTLEGHRGSVSAVLFVDDGKTLISGCDRGLLKFWDTTTGKETASRRRHKQQLYCANVSPDQKWLITGGGHWAKGDPGELIVWDLAKRQFKATLPGHTLTVWSIMFTPDGKYFATSDSAGDVKIWNTETLQEVRTLKHQTWVRPMAMSPDGKTLAVGRGDGPVRLWDTATWTEKGTCNGHDSFTFWLQYSPDGKTLATSGNDGTVRFWETQSESVE